MRFKIRSDPKARHSEELQSSLAAFRKVLAGVSGWSG